MIELNQVSRWYGQVIGLNDVTATFEPGITALLGMNGAGKSTLMRLVSGQLRPTTGEVKVFGENPFANPSVFNRLGYCPEIDNFYEHWTGRRFIHFLARLDGMNHAEATRRTEEVLQQVGMIDRADRPIAGFSKGMRQRIKLAQAMLHDPDVILLDEPLNGLDPVGRREFITLLAWLADKGKTIVVSSHILFEVEQMTRAIILLHRGRLMASGDLGVIRSLIDKYPHKVRIATDDPRKVAAAIADLPNIVSIKYEVLESGLQLEVNDPDSFYQAFNALTLEKNLPVSEFNSPDNNLEAVFSYLVNA